MTPSQQFQHNLRFYEKHYPAYAEQLKTYANEYFVEITKTEDNHTIATLIHNQTKIQKHYAIHDGNDSLPLLRNQYRSVQWGKDWVVFYGMDSLELPSLPANPSLVFTPWLVVDSDWERVVAYLHAIDYSGFFPRPNLYLYHGEDAERKAVADLDQTLAPYFSLPSGMKPLFQPPSDFEKRLQLTRFVQTLQKRFQQMAKQSQSWIQTFQQHLSSIRLSRIRKIMLVIPKVECWRILACGLSYGFRQNGVDVIEVPVSFPPSNISVYESLSLLRKMHEICPDTIVTLSHPSDLFIRGIQEVPVPRIVWYVDEPDHVIQHPHNSNDFVFYSWREFGDRLQKRGGRFMGEILTGSQPMQPALRDEFACEVAFVGSLNDTSHIRKQFSDDLLHRIDCVVEHKLREIKQSIPTLIETYGIRVDEQKRIVEAVKPDVRKQRLNEYQTILFYFHLECILKRRLALILSLEGFDVQVYGNDTWGERLEGTSLASAFQGRPISYHETIDLYRSAAISLNMHSPYLHSGPNQRDIDIPVCGGFVLSDIQLHAQDRMEEFFVPQKEIALYRDENDLPQRVRFYLDHPEERQQIAEAGRARIAKDHSFEKRCRDILARLQEADPSGC